MISYYLHRTIEDVTHFSLSGLLQRRQLTYGAKQLIAREVSLGYSCVGTISMFSCEGDGSLSGYALDQMFALHSLV